jgi:hypothetical protein
MGSKLKYTAGMLFLVSFFTFCFAQVNWSINTPVKSISTVIWAGTQFVAVGENGVYTSKNGTAWNGVIVNGFGRYNKAVWTGSKIFVFSDSTIQTSTNGTVWTSTPCSPFYEYSSVLYEESLFVAIRTDELATSQDGITWTKRHSFFTAKDYNSSLAYGNGIFIATVYDSIFLSQNGIDWKGIYKMKEYSSKCIWNGSLFTVIGGNGTVLTSVNGTVWNENKTFTTGISSILWNGSQFIMGSGGGLSDQLFTSTDCIRWTAHPIPVQYSFTSMVCSPDGHIAAIASNRMLFASSDGIIWHNINNQQISTIIRNSNTWILANNKELYSSDDCLLWSAVNTPIQTPALSLTIKEVVLKGKDLVVLYSEETTQGSTRIFTSTGSYNWKETCNFDYCKINSIANGTDKLIGVGRRGTVLCITGNEKIFCNSGTYSELNSVIWTGAQFVTVGNAGVILVSPDGISWSRKSVPIAYDLMSVVWTGSQLVAVGGMGIVMTSPDGNTWTVQNSGVQYKLLDIACGPQNQLAAIGRQSNETTESIILSSSDGVNWVKRLTYNQDPFVSVAYGDSQFAAVGYYGTIAVAPLSTSGSPVLKKTAAPTFNPEVTQNGITIDLEAGNYEVSIIDMAGRNVYESRGSTLSPTRRSFLPELASNCYIVKLAQNGQVRKKTVHLKR